MRGTSYDSPHIADVDWHSDECTVFVSEDAMDQVVGLLQVEVAVMQDGTLTVDISGRKAREVKVTVR